MKNASLSFVVSCGGAWEFGWYLIALGLPLLLALVATLLYTLAGGSGFIGPRFGQLVGLAPQLLWAIVLGGPLEEEPGWRGFAFPLLRARTTAVVSSLIIGVIWGFWHLPLFLLPGTSQYVLVTQHPLGILWFVGFVVQTTSLSVLSGWLVTRTGESVPIAIVFHAAANTAFSLLAILGIYDAWQALLLYVGLLVLTAVLVIVTTGPHLTGRFTRFSSPKSLERKHPLQEQETRSSPVSAKNSKN
jgi:CAAX protease family protein